MTGENKAKIVVIKGIEYEDDGLLSSLIVKALTKLDRNSPLANKLKKEDKTSTASQQTAEKLVVTAVPATTDPGAPGLKN